jgi:hypothetical protein
MRLNSRTLAAYPADAVFRNIRLTYALRGDRLVWTRWASLTKAEIMALRKQHHGRSNLRWEGDCPHNVVGYQNKCLRHL